MSINQKRSITMQRKPMLATQQADKEHSITHNTTHRMHIPRLLALLFPSKHSNATAHTHSLADVDLDPQLLVHVHSRSTSSHCNALSMYNMRC